MPSAAFYSLVVASALGASAGWAHADTGGADLVARAEPASEGTRRFGLMLDGGLPDGATASLVWKPLRSLRLNAGISYNGVSRGYRGGLTVIPFNTWIAPVLAVDYGHYADGDANPLVRTVTSDPTFESVLLDRVGYNYLDGHLGLEVGRTWFTFYLHAGFTQVTGKVHELSTVGTGSMPTTVTFGSDPSVTLTSVSARLGFIFYFAK